MGDDYTVAGHVRRHSKKTVQLEAHEIIHSGEEPNSVRSFHETAHSSTTGVDLLPDVRRPLTNNYICNVTRSDIKPMSPPTPQSNRYISDESIERLETIYLCPLLYTGTDKEGTVKWTFRTSKKCMKEWEAARHLSKDHKVKLREVEIARLHEDRAVSVL